MGLPIAKNDEFHKHTDEIDTKRRESACLQDVKKIIGIHSGKGGVGKTFLTANLACKLAEEGYSVGILDADVDCPNLPKFLKISSRLHINKEKRFIPVIHHGIKVVSTGLTQDDEGVPFLIRGPAKHRLVIDLLMNTEWGSLDILLVDLPPGTADVPLSVLEFGEVDGVLYVTSPDSMAIMDTKKSIMMTREIGIPQLGVVENLSGDIFGSGAARKLAAEVKIPYLGSIPLKREIANLNKRGEPIFTQNTYEELANTLTSKILENTK